MRTKQLHRIIATIVAVATVTTTLTFAPATVAVAAAEDAPVGRARKTMLSGGDVEGSNTVVAADGSTVYAAWQDRRFAGADSGRSIVFRRSTDGGVTWLSHRVLTNTSDASEPAVVASGDDVHVAWLQGTSSASSDRGHAAVYVTSSNDRGQTFGTPQRLDSAGVGDSRNVHLAADGARIAAVWYDAGRDVQVAVSETRGEYFESSTVVGEGIVWTGEQPVAIDGDVVAVAWTRRAAPEKVPATAHVATSTDGGLVFADPTQVSDDPEGTRMAHSPAVAVTGDVVDVVWGDQTDVVGTHLDLNAIVARRSTDAGTSWNAVEQLGAASPAYPSGSPTIASDGRTVAAAWRQAGTGRVEVSTSDIRTLAWSSPTVVTGRVEEPPSLATPARPVGDGPLAEFTWSMPERFGGDDNGDGMVDYDTSFGHVNESTFPVSIDGCDSDPGTGPADDLELSWEIDGIDLGIGECAFTHDLTEGSHVVRLTAANGAESDELVRTIEVEDHLIVSVGDSVASGEGNPDIPSGDWPWSDSARWQDRQCNRSAHAGPARAADLVEQGDVRSSVTFVHLACSGASVLGPDNPNGGLITPYTGINPDDGELLDPQLDQIEDLVVGREVDALFVSIGANDLHFSAVVGGCLIETDCHLPEGSIPQDLATRFADLPAHYEALDARIQELGIPSDKVFITEYFDPTTDRTGAINLRCVGNAPNIPFFQGITDAETRWARVAVVQELNKALTEAAGTYGWNVVTGIERAFLGHGYCSDDSWVVTLGDSFGDQGDKNGSFHPNNAGHAWYGKQLAEAFGTGTLPDVEPGDAPEGGSTDTFGEFYLATADRTDVHVTSLISTGAGLQASSSTNVSRAASLTGATMPDIVATDSGAWVGWTEALTDGPGVDKYQAFAGRGAVAAPDLEIGDVTMVQAPADATALVAAKGAAVRVEVRSTLPSQRVVQVGFEVTDSSGAVVSAHEVSANIAPGDSVLHLTPPGSAIVPGPGQALSATVSLDVTDLVGEADENDNDASSDPMTVRTSRTLRVLVIPVGVLCASATGVADAAERWLGATYPVADGDLIVDTSCSTTLPGLSLASGPDVTRSLTVLDRVARLNGYDHVVGVVPNGRLSVVGDAAGIGLVGSEEDAGPAAAGVLVELGNGPSVVGHEVGHNLGLDHTEDLPAPGYWVEARTEQRGTDLMDHMVRPQPWIAAETFERLLLRLQLTAEAGGLAPADQEVLTVSGIIRDGGDVVFEPFVRGTGRPDVELVAAATPALRLQYRSAADGVLGTVVLPAARVDGSGDVRTGARGFSAHIPWVDGAARIVVIDSYGSLRASRDISASAPTVAVTGPTAGTSIPAGGSMVVSWDQEDADGGVLTASVDVSADGGPWRPLATGVTDGRIALQVARDLAGDEVVVRVTVTDGVRSAVATSDAFRVEAAPTPPEQRLAVIRNTQNSGLGGTTSIWTMRPDGSDLRLVTDALDSAWNVDWARDGQRLAFSSSNEVGDDSAGDEDVFIVDLDGTDLVNVTAGLPASPSADRTCPDWSPDGASISYLERGRAGDPKTYVQVLDLASTTAKTVATIGSSGIGVSCPRFSPDGTRLVYEDGGKALVTDLDPATDAVTQAWGRFDAAIESFGAAWTPEGRVLLSTSEPSRDGVWSVDADGSDPARHVTPYAFTTADGESTLFTLTPKVSAEGDRVYFRTQIGNSTNATSAVGVRLICSTDLDGSDRRCAQDEVLSDLGGGFIDADWSPVDVVIPAPPAPPEPPALADVDAGGPYTAIEDDPGSVLSAGGRLLADEIPAASWDLDGDGAFDDALGLTPSVTFADAGEHTVAVHLTMADGSTATDTATVTVTGSAPTVPDIAATLVLVGERATLTARFTDPGTGTHTVTFNGRQGTVTEADGVGTATITLDLPATPGIYDVPVLVCDADGAYTTCVEAVAPVFVEGGGPVAWEIGPSDGPVAGGTPVGIEGLGLSTVTEVRVGDVSVPFTHRADGFLEIVTPPSPSGAPGAFGVTVTGPLGTSAVGTSTTFTYADNAAPRAEDVDASLDGGPSNVVLRATDADGDPVTFRVVEAPAHGEIVSVHGALAVYVPESGYVGTDSFTYAAADDRAEGPSATATLTVGNRPPVAGAPAFVSEGGQLDLVASDLLDGATDPDGDVPAVGSVVAGPDTAGRVGFDGQRVAFVPAAGFTGETTFEFELVDGRGGVSVGTATVDVRGTVVVDEPPTVEAGPGLDGVEAAPIPVSAEVGDDGETPPVLRWTAAPGDDVDAGATCAFADATAATTTVTCTDDGTWTLTITASDGVNDAVSDTTTLDVANTDPTITITAPTTGTEVETGRSVPFEVEVSDPADELLGCRFTWATGSDEDVATDAGTCSAAHVFDTAGPVTVTMAVDDGDGGTAEAEVALQVVAPQPSDTPPTVDAGAEISTVEGAAADLAAKVDDDHGPVTTEWTVEPGGGVDGGAGCTFVDAGAATTEVTCTDDGTWTLTVTADDGVNPPVSDSVVLTVAGAAPTVELVDPPEGVAVPAGSDVGVLATVTDAGANDTVTCRIAFGDGAVETVSVVDGRCEAAHTWSAAGSRTIEVTATDDDGLSGSDRRTVSIAGETTSRVFAAGLVTARQPAALALVEPTSTSSKSFVQIRTTKGWFTAITTDRCATSGKTATCSATGTWNRTAGYRYELTVTDGGIGFLGLLRNKATAKVVAPDGTVVWSTGGTVPLIGAVAIRPV